MGALSGVGVGTESGAGRLRWSGGCGTKICDKVELALGVVDGGGIVDACGVAWQAVGSVGCDCLTGLPVVSIFSISSIVTDRCNKTLCISKGVPKESKTDLLFHLTMIRSLSEVW